MGKKNKTKRKQEREDFLRRMNLIADELSSQLKILYNDDTAAKFTEFRIIDKGNSSLSIDFQIKMTGNKQTLEIGFESFHSCKMDDTYNVNSVLNIINGKYKSKINEKMAKIQETKQNTLRNKLLAEYLPLLKKHTKLNFTDNGNLLVDNNVLTNCNIADILFKEGFKTEKSLDKYGVCKDFRLVPICKTMDKTAKAVSKSFLAKIKNTKITLSGRPKMLNEIEQQFAKVKNEFIKFSNPVLFGVSFKEKDFNSRKYYCLGKDLNTFYMETKVCTVIIKNDKVTCKYSQKLDEYLKFVKRSDNSKARKYIEKIIKKAPCEIEYSNGAGILCGSDVNIKVIDKKTGLGIKEKLSPLTIENEDWKTVFEEDWNRILKALNEHVRKEEEFLVQKYSPFKTSVLAKEILSLVESNEFITERGIIAVTRGLKNSYELKISTCLYQGRFRDISSEDVSIMIRKLCLAGILSTRIVDGYYQDYEKIVLGKNYQNEKKFLEYKTPSNREICKKVKNRASLNFYETKAYMDYMKTQEHLSIPQYMDLFYLATNVEFCCLYRNEYVSIFKEAPNEFKQFVKMTRENTEDRRLRKLYKSILDAIGNGKKGGLN